MSRSAKSVLAFSIYLFGLGPLLLVVPNRFLALFRMPPVDDVWIHVVGMLVLILAAYYLQAARHELRPFFVVSVLGRFSVLVFFTAFVALALAPPILIAFGVVDAAGAAWTALALRRDAAG